MEAVADSELGFSFRGVQFNLKVAFIITVNHCQGQTKRCVVYQPQRIFTHCQMCVALIASGQR